MYYHSPSLFRSTVTAIPSWTSKQPQAQEEDGRLKKEVQNEEKENT